MKEQNDKKADLFFYSQLWSYLPGVPLILTMTLVPATTLIGCTKKGLYNLNCHFALPKMWTLKFLLDYPFWICNDSLPVKTSTAYPVMWYAQSHSKVNSEFHHDMRHQNGKTPRQLVKGPRGKWFIWQRFKDQRLWLTRKHQSPTADDHRRSLHQSALAAGPLL